MVKLPWTLAMHCALQYIIHVAILVCLIVELFLLVLDVQELSTPPPQHGRKSIAEKDDELLPLRTMLPASRRGKRLLPTHSDAADSAVSMVSCNS